MKQDKVFVQHTSPWGDIGDLKLNIADLLYSILRRFFCQMLFRIYTDVSRTFKGQQGRHA